MGELSELIEEWPDLGDEFNTPAAKAFGSVEISAILGPGIYALCRGGEIVYIGKAKLLVQRLYNQWNLMQRRKAGRPLPKTGAFSRVKAVVFNGIKVWPCQLSDLDRLEREMIAKHRPKYNILLVPNGKVSLTAVGFDYTKLNSKTNTLVRRV